jgi:predicted DNA-binding transcriptional regulator AlpA
MPKNSSALAIDDLRVITLQEFAASQGLSFATVQRMIARGEGPRTIRLSLRRVGVRIIDLKEWQQSRVRT